LQHFEVLLEGIVSNAGQRLWELPLLSEAERVETIRGWNETKRVVGPEGLLHELFAAQAAQQPEAVAVVCGAEQLSYGELDRRANQLAHYLRRQGVGAEVVVGLCLERSLELVVGMLGILKAGGAYLPLDPHYPEERLRFQLADSGSAVLLTEARYASLGAGSSARVVLLEEMHELLASESEAAPEVAAVSAATLAYPTVGNHR
jgi:non-ribosomal peptide synthetase component F